MLCCHHEEYPAQGRQGIATCMYRVNAEIEKMLSFINYVVANRTLKWCCNVVLY